MATRPVTPTTTDKTRLSTSILSGITLNKAIPTPIGQDKQSKKVSGLAKAVSIFYKILFTAKGSNPLNQLEGTNLVDLYQSSITDIDTLYVDVSLAVGEAFTQLSAIQTRNQATAAEKIVGVDIVDFRTTVPSAGTINAHTSLNFSLLFRNAAGDQSPFETPSIVLT